MDRNLSGILLRLKKQQLQTNKGLLRSFVLICNEKLIYIKKKKETSFLFLIF